MVNGYYLNPQQSLHNIIHQKDGEADWGSGYKDVQLFIHGIEEDRMSVVPIWDVLEASTRVKDFIEEYNRTPRTVGVATETVSRESFNRMMLASVLEIFEDTYRNILLMDIGTAPNPTGNMQDSRMDLEDYMDSAKRAFMWIMERERMPNFVSTPLGNMSPFNLTDMYSRILNFYREHERLPNYVTVQRERGAPSDNIGGNLTSQLRTALGSNFSNATGLWSALRRRPYSFYFNSRYTENQRLQRISQGLGLNCTDYSLVLYKVLKELGYEVHAVRGEVLCSSGWIGHVWLEIRGREFSNWVFYDSVTATSNKGNINRLCCHPFRNRTYNPGWFMNML